MILHTYRCRLIVKGDGIKIEDKKVITLKSEKCTYFLSTHEKIFVVLVKNQNKYFSILPHLRLTFQERKFTMEFSGGMKTSLKCKEDLTNLILLIIKDPLMRLTIDRIRDKF